MTRTEQTCHSTTDSAPLFANMSTSASLEALATNASLTCSYGNKCHFYLCLEELGEAVQFGLPPRVVLGGFQLQVNEAVRHRVKGQRYLECLHLHSCRSMVPRFVTYVLLKHSWERNGGGEELKTRDTACSIHDCYQHLATIPPVPSPFSHLLSSPLQHSYLSFPSQSPFPSLHPFPLLLLSPLPPPSSTPPPLPPPSYLQLLVTLGGG